MAETTKPRRTRKRQTKQKVSENKPLRRIIVYPGAEIGEGWQKHVEGLKLVSIVDVLTSRRDDVAAVTTWGALISRMLRIDVTRPVEVVCVGFDEQQAEMATKRLKKWKNATTNFA